MGVMKASSASDLFGSDPFWRGWLEPICIGCGSADFFGGVEWISRLRSSKSASTIPNIVVAKPSGAITKPNIVIIGRRVRGGPEKEIKKTKGQICIHVTVRNVTCDVMIR